MEQNNGCTLVSLLSEKKVAEILGVSVATMRAARCVGHMEKRMEIPPFIRIGRRVCYHPDDIAAYIQKLRVEPGK